MIKIFLSITHIFYFKYKKYSKTNFKITKFTILQLIKFHVIYKYMKKVLVSGYIGFNNFGDEAIFLALSSHLKSKKCSVSALCNNENEVKKTYDVITYNYKKPFEILKAILLNDILISGGGSLLQNKTSNFSLIYYLFIIFLAKFFNKKVIIFAQGIEPINGKFFEFLTKTVLKMTNFISVRDKKSQNLLNSWNIKTELLSDPAYSLIENIEINQDKKGLIVQLRSFEGIDDKFISDLADVIAKYYQGEITVLSLQNEYDKDICLSFIEKLKKYNANAKFIPYQGIKETIDVLNNAKYVISARLHGLIVSYALENKCFGLIYDEKIRTLCDELNIENIEIKNYQKDELDIKLNNFFNNNSPKTHPYRPFVWDCIDNVIEK